MLSGDKGKRRETGMGGKEKARKMRERRKDRMEKKRVKK